MLEFNHLVKTDLSCANRCELGAVFGKSSSNCYFCARQFAFIALRLLGLVDKHSLAPTSPDGIPSQRPDSGSQYSKGRGRFWLADNKTTAVASSCANRSASDCSHSQANQGRFFGGFRTDFVDAQNILSAYVRGLPLTD